MSTHSTRFRNARLLRVLAAAAALTLGLSACSSAVDEQSGGSGGSGGGDPKSGGVLQVGTTSDLVPAGLFTNSSQTTDTLIGQVYDSLIDYPLDSLDPQPRLATSWETSADGLSTTLNLRDDVTFHDGSDFTSDDVAYSIKTWADPKWTVQFQRTAAAVTGFDTSDPHKIVLTFAKPISNLFDLFDVMPIVDDATFDTEATGQSYNGTGPFKFDSWTPGSKIVLERNDDYWDGAPYLDGVQINIVPDAQTVVSQLRSGQLDLILGTNNRDAESLGDAGGFEVYPFEGSDRQTYVGTNVNNPALADVRVRKAIALAVDKDRIVDEVYRGVGKPISLPWPEYSPAYDEEKNETYSRDVEAAKALVKEVGDIPTLPLEYSTALANHEAIAQIVQENLAEVGIKVELQPNEQPDQIAKLIGGTFPGLWILDHAYAQYTPSTLAVTAYPFNADKNSSNFVDPTYKADAVSAWEQIDPSNADAVEAYGKLSDDLLDNLFLIELATTYFQAVTGDNVHDFTWTKRSEPVLAKTWLAS
jgi:peptide/nickel transport system substrate-binding protein